MRRRPVVAAHPVLRGQDVGHGLDEGVPAADVEPRHEEAGHGAGLAVLLGRRRAHHERDPTVVAQRPPRLTDRVPGDRHGVECGGEHETGQHRQAGSRRPGQARCLRPDEVERGRLAVAQVDHHGSLTADLERGLACNRSHLHPLGRHTDSIHCQHKPGGPVFLDFALSVTNGSRAAAAGGGGVRRRVQAPQWTARVWDTAATGVQCQCEGDDQDPGGPRQRGQTSGPGCCR